jgi:hypothetical protein
VTCPHLSAAVIPVAPAVGRPVGLHADHANTMG